MKRFIVLMFVIVLLAPCYTAVAQDDEIADVIDEIPWAENLAIGTVTLSAFVWAATELSKRLLALFGLLYEDQGRWIAIAWSIVFVVLALVVQYYGVEDTVGQGIDWVYQGALLVLTLIGAPSLHYVAKGVGLVKPATPKPGIGVHSHNIATSTKDK